ncbi:hypothetical protein MHBO_000522 [Bonamia ostreae]|uniref:Protein kinase domain-containing protein n=1 Tax=Bonamia ostreae TaxID=126728 RepID=A0ABV2AFV3_9EUKA
MMTAYEDDVWTLGILLKKIADGEDVHYDRNAKRIKIEYSPDLIARDVEEVLEGFLNVDAAERWGLKDFEQIKGKRLFYGLDWDDLPPINQEI